MGVSSVWKSDAPSAGVCKYIDTASHAGNISAMSPKQNKSIPIYPNKSIKGRDVHVMNP